MKEENLIFIISQPRAGSTFLQNVLSNNPVTNTVSEPWIMLPLTSVYAGNTRASYNSKLAARAFQEYEKRFNLNIRSEVRSTALKFYEPLFKGYDYAIDKTPRYWEILDELIELFPKSKFIILKRNPVNVAKSMINTWEIKSLERLNNFRRDLLLAPIALQSFLEKNVKKPNVYGVCYESILADSKGEISKIYTWLGIDFNDSYIDTIKNTKYKGLFGDPYQNQHIKKAQVNSVDDRKTNHDFDNFFKGYSNYLGEPFLKSYGSYSNNSAKTLEFNYYLNLGDLYRLNESSLKRELVLLAKRTSLKFKRLGKLFLLM